MLRQIFLEIENSFRYFIILQVNEHLSLYYCSLTQTGKRDISADENISLNFLHFFALNILGSLVHHVTSTHSSPFLTLLMHLLLNNLPRARPFCFWMTGLQSVSLMFLFYIVLYDIIIYISCLTYQATPDMAVTLLEIARIFATKVPGKIDADVLQLLWKVSSYFGISNLSEFCPG